MTALASAMTMIREGARNAAGAVTLLPWWLALGLAALTVVVGVVLTLNPFASLAVLVVGVVLALALAGVSELATADRTGTARWQLIRGPAYLAAAVAVLAWPGRSLRLLTVVLALSLVVGGALEVLQARHRRGVERANLLVSGASGIVLGLVALSWPDVSVLVVAVVLGVRTIVLGVRQAAQAWRRRGGAVVERTAPRPGWLRLGGATLGLLGALALLAVTAAVKSASPRRDAFYTAPAEVPDRPGALLRAEPFDRGIPDGADGWRILYTTTRDDGVPAVASAIVVRPDGQDGPSPLIAWAHGTTGTVPGCAPSVLEDTFETGAFYLAPDVVEQGWTLVSTDYVGLGTEGPHPYLIGQGVGRSVLDSVRAAQEFTELDLDGSTVVWGHSQGGGAALWTGVLAATYAPELRIDGVAALAPAANLPGLVGNLESVPAGSLFASYVITAYDDEYDDVRLDDVVRPGAQTVIEEMATRCLAEPGVLVSVLTSFGLDQPIWSRDPREGALGERLRQNVPDGPIDAPLLLAQGGADQLVLPAAQDAYVQDRCDDGHAVDYRVYEGRDHVPLVEPDSPLVPDLLQWTRDRLAGEEPLDTCG